MCVFEKKSWEDITFAINLSGMAEIQEGEAILSAVVTVWLGEQQQTDMLLDSSFVSATNTVLFRVKGGLLGENYKINIRITTVNAEHKREFNFLLKIREKFENIC